MTLPKPILTKEHGSWAVLLIPLAGGVAVGGTMNRDVIFFLFSVLGIFLSYVPLQILIRDRSGMVHGPEKIRSAQLWGAVYILAGLVAALPLFLKHYWILPAIGLAACCFFTAHFLIIRKHGKTVGGDFVAMMGLTLTAPGAYYVVTRNVDDRALFLWLAYSLFFGSGIVYVHMKILGTGMKRAALTWTEKLSLGRINLLYHLLIIVVMIPVIGGGRYPELAAAAFLPMIVHAVYGTVRYTHRVRFKQLGLLMLAHAAFFGFMFSVAMAPSS